MARRTFVYDPVSKTLVEVTRGSLPEAPAVQADIEPFLSPVDGTVISSRSQLRDHMGQHDLVPYDEVADGKGKKIDRYQGERERRSLRERLWEYTDRALRTGRAT